MRTLLLVSLLSAVGPPTTQAAILAANASTHGIRVIGAGLSRTATQSLAMALQRLGYRTLHAEGFHPEMPMGRGNDLVSTVYEAAIQYFRTKDISAMLPAFDLVDEMRIDAVVDLPWSELVPDLLQRYPGAKVVVTVRDSAEKWYRSYWEHFRWASIFPPGLAHPFVAYWRDITTSTGCGFVTRFPPWFPEVDRQACLAAYDAHVENMRRLVPEGQLLIFNVREGWEPLARFLGEEVPKGAAFPRTDAYTFLHWRSSTRAFCFAIYLAYACVALLLWAGGTCALGCLRRRVGGAAKSKEA